MDANGVPQLRPMTEDDLTAVVDSAYEAFRDLATRTGRPEPSRPDPPPPGSMLHHLVGTYPDGAWVATADGEVCGASMAGLRDSLWYLAHLQVKPEYQGQGLGRRLLDAALSYGAGARGWLLHSSLDPHAIAGYQRAGFALEPAMHATGRVRRAELPAISGVRTGDADDLELAADVDRAQRGAAHGPDLEQLLAGDSRLLVAEDGPRRGYAVVGAGPQLLAATDIATAAALLWTALAESGDGDITVRILRAGQQYAFDICHRAGLRMKATGPLCRQGEIGPMLPYLPHNGIL